MVAHIIVSAQISSLFPSAHALSLVVQTRRTDIPLPDESDSEHASYAESFYAQSTGTILLRVIHGGHIIELISLSSDLPPLRFVYPSPVLPHPSLLLDDEDLHLLAVTRSGSLFRVVIPLNEGGPMWHAGSLSTFVVRERVVARVKGNVVPQLAHIQGLQTVVAGLSDGSLVRLETDRVANESEDDEWREMSLYSGSLLGSITSFLHASSPGGSDIVCVASHPQPTDIGYIWTLSRDRTLRLWTPAGGCVSQTTLSAVASGRSVTPAGIAAPKPSVLLHPHPQNLLRVYTPIGQENPHVVVFIPTETSTTGGGYFQVFCVFGEYLQTVKVMQCSPQSVHCHLHDFIIVSGVLYSLWDKQGQSTVETAILSLNESEEPHWHAAAYPPESELTPAYLDELLLSPGSLTDKFLNAVMRPGLFSVWTLHKAITQYTDACLSLPGPPPLPLQATYATLGEHIAAVVGCTVKLAKDTKTGAPQYDNYWNALKRDWEGFVARCREIERSARWPLALGVGDAKGQILVVERERIGSIVDEDLALHYQRLLSQPASSSAYISPQHPFLEVLWSLREKLGPRCMHSLETRLIDLAHQEIAFPYADIIQDQARIALKDEIDEGLESWIAGRLQSVGDLQDSTRHLLDLIGGFDREVKKEEDEVELLLPSTHLDWNRALVSSYVTSSVNARYDLALLLIVMLFFLTDEIPQWEPSLLGEIFVVFRGIAMLQHTSRQPAGVPQPQSLDAGGDDEVIAKFRNLDVSAGRARYEPSYSLLHRLFTQFGTPSALPGAAHHFLDATGLLAGLTPAHASKPEVLFCERLRTLGYREAARDALAWLPRTPAVIYVLLRVWLDEGRYEDAAAALESLAWCFDTMLPTEDREALTAVLPASHLLSHAYDFYLHAASLFRAHAVTTYEVSFTQLALSVVPLDIEHPPSTREPWQTVIKGNIALGLFEEAYAAIVSSPHDDLKAVSTEALVDAMCEGHAVDRLMTFNFAGIVDKLEDALSFKARHANPTARPFYSRILYTWYTSRGDYRNAALTMYQRARKLAALRSEKSDQFIGLSEQQLEAYGMSINALSLIDPKAAWIILPYVAGAENGTHSSKRRKLSQYIPENRFTNDARASEVVELSDIQYEYALLSAQLELVKEEPKTLAAGEALLGPSSVVSKLAQAGHYNMAIHTALSLKVDMAELFEQLTISCLHVSLDPDAFIDDTTDWLLTDKLSSWTGTPADRGWRYLRQALERYDGPASNYAYTKAVLDTILGFGRLSTPPPWLIQSLQEHHPEYLIQSCLRFGMIDSALEHTLSMVRRDDARLERDLPSGPAATWLPYTLIDQVLAAAGSGDEPTARTRSMHQELQSEIASRLKRLQKYDRETR